MRHIQSLSMSLAIKKFTPFVRLLFVMQILVRNVGAGIQRNSLICNDTTHEHHPHYAKLVKTTTTEKPFIEYYMEHEVTEKEARHTMQLLMRRDKDFDNKRPVRYCEKCTEQIQKYCLGPTFLKDHCCCDFRHETETLPFIPHSCYAAEDQCRPSSIVQSSCMNYEEMRECCCDQLLKKTYKAIYSNSPTINRLWSIIFLCLSLVAGFVKVNSAN
ncbi:uncharacterized protein LOC134834987 [Culicoides brevitarsis]|uniref:uncharacterized protein LOC134834987 n=1 Tax=Culicoides brevitarsis TaxID=469753 RepID=UPI00307C9139